MSRTVELRIGGQSYRVVSSAPEAELQRLASVVNRKLAEVGPTSRTQPNGLLLVAMALAHDVEEERQRRASLEERVRSFLGGVVQRIDRALGGDGSVAD
jgi:cell division protein ZapA